MNQNSVAHQLLACVQLLTSALEDVSGRMRQIEAALHEHLGREPSKAEGSSDPTQPLDHSPVVETPLGEFIEIPCRACGDRVRQSPSGQIFNWDNDLDHAQSCTHRRALKPQILP